MTETSNTYDITLRDPVDDDLPIFFEQQRDPEANHMAAFTAPDPDNRKTFMESWGKMIRDDAILMKTILYGDSVAGHVEHFELFGDPAVGYWIGNDYWGKGIATAALRLFLQEVGPRPLYARVAQDNIGSLRVLEKCGFVKWREESGFANARGAETAEFVFRLDP